MADGLPIRTLSELTGVPATTLRAWERRYGLLRPQRTAKGHRLYTEEDVALVRRVVGLLAQGRPIREAAEVAGAGAPAVGRTRTAGPWAELRGRLTAAIEAFDTGRLDALYNEALSLYPVDLVMESLVRPVLDTLGGRWGERETGIAEEHFFSTFLRNKLGARLHHAGPAGRGPLLLTACVPGEHHELGFLMFLLAAVARGYRVTHLGPDLPVAQAAAAAQRLGPNGVLYSRSHAPLDARTRADLAAMAGEGPPVCLGGPLSDADAEALRVAGILPLGDRFGTAMDRLDARLAARRPR